MSPPGVAVAAHGGDRRGEQAQGNGVHEPSREKGEREAEDADIGLKERPQAGSGATTIGSTSDQVRTVSRQFSHE